MGIGNGRSAIISAYLLNRNDMIMNPANNEMIIGLILSFADLMYDIMNPFRFFCSDSFCLFVKNLYGKVVAIKTIMTYDSVSII